MRQGDQREGLEAGDSQGVKRISVTEGTCSGAGAVALPWISRTLLFQVAGAALMKSDGKRPWG